MTWVDASKHTAYNFCTCRRIKTPSSCGRPKVVDQVNDQLLPRSSYCHTRCAYGSQQPYQSATSTVTLDSERGTQASPRLGVGWTTASAVDRLAAKFKRCAPVQHVCFSDVLC